MLIRPLTRRKFLALSTAAATMSTLGRVFAEEPTAKSEVATGTNQFGTDLYGQLQKEKGNVFFSPYSISTALAMTAAGAKGDTLSEFQKTLHLPADMRIAHDGFAELMSKINGPAGAAEKRPFQLNTTNALWAQKGYPWRPEFTGLARKNYGAYIEDVDYGMPEVARETINKWIEKQTKEKIKDLIGKGVLTPLTRLVLTNAIYFKAEWLSQFEKTFTKDAAFTTDGGRQVQVPLMQQQSTFAYGENAEFQVVELPYVGRELSMVVLLPTKADGLAKIEADLSAEKLQKWTTGLVSQKVRVFLPKFKVETSYQLKQPLQTLGLKKAFGFADFSGMTTGDEPLQIAEVIHKAFVNVDEAGTEAAAATAVVMRAGSAARPAEPKVFRADRPFMFALRHIGTGSVLFMGRVSNPK